MRIKEGFVLRDVAGKAVAIAVGEASRAFNGMIRLNESGREIWRGAANGLSEEEIAGRLAAAYGIGMEKARADTKAMLTQMREIGAIDG